MCALDHSRTKQVWQKDWGAGEGRERGLVLSACIQWYLLPTHHLPHLDLCIYVCVYLFILHHPVRLEMPQEERTMVIIFSSVCRDCGSLSAIKLHEQTKQVKARTCLTPKREIQRATFRFGQWVAYLDRERKPPHQPGLCGSCPTQQQERHEIKGLENCSVSGGRAHCQA